MQYPENPSSQKHLYFGIKFHIYLNYFAIFQG